MIVVEHKYFGGGKKMKVNMEYAIEKLEHLLNIPSPSGNTHKAMDFIEKEFKALGIPTYRTNKGALVGKIEGVNTEKEVTLSGMWIH